MRHQVLLRLVGVERGQVKLLILAIQWLRPIPAVRLRFYQILLIAAQRHASSHTFFGIYRVALSLLLRIKGLMLQINSSDSSLCRRGACTHDLIDHSDRWDVN